MCLCVWGACITLLHWHAAGKGFRETICKTGSLRKGGSLEGGNGPWLICEIISAIPSISMILPQALACGRNKEYG